MKKNIIPCIIILLLAGCSDPYTDLEKAFPAKSKIDGKKIKSNTIILTSQNHKGAYSFYGSSTVFLSQEIIEIYINIPTYERVQIPVKEINGCGMTCFGPDDWHADILLGSKGIEISFKQASEVIDWCWKVGLPMITGKNKRNWMYKGGVLPSREDYKQVGREEYRRETARRCQGF